MNPLADRVAHGLEHVAAAPSAVCIGFFDGVHRGHAAIIAQAQDAARTAGLRSVVVTFDRHPMEVVRPGSQPPLLMTLRRRLATLAGLGVDLVVALEFDDDLRHRTPREFAEHVLAGALQARHVVVGANFRFGHKAAGDEHTLAELGAELGFSSTAVRLLADTDEPISSSQIRRALERGDVPAAARMLGRPHIVDGIVVRGDRRGRALGFPTANLQADPRAAVPAAGVYAGRFHLPDGRAPACAISVGTNPTFDGRTLRLEAYLLDFDEDLYGIDAGVDFRHHLRPERRYDRVEDLVSQMHTDVDRTRALLGA